MSRERYSKQFIWYRSLAETERSLLDYICSEILNRAGQALMALNGETLLRKALTTGEDSTKFYQEEQKNALNLALSRPLHNLVELSDLLKSILYEIRTGEISAADLYHLNSDGPEFSGSKADPWSFKWFEPAVEVASYLVYVAQIEHIVRSGILESNRRPENESVYSINEILQLLARQVIISVGGIDEILGQNQPEGTSRINFKKLPSEYSEEQMRRIFDKCTYLRLTNKRDKENFISLFSYPEGEHQKIPQGPSERVFWNGKKRDAKVALYGIIHKITGKVPTAAMLRIYFNSNHMIKDQQYQKDKDNGEYPSPKFCDLIFAGI